jgi:small GTP-binding protein
MKGATRFVLEELGQRGEALIARAGDLLRGADDDALRQLVQRLPASMIAEDESPRLVVAGEYSAGKSTLISALTGRDDIAIGRAITTDRAAPYPWSGITLWDTPGIHTEVRPDHDAITYEQIAAADLLLFVISANLMDDHVAQHFRKLAVEQGKGHELLLVVNKMSAHQDGNSPEARAVIREDLAAVVAPYTPAELRISFTDARLALDSRAEADPEAAREDWADSGIDQLVENLNRFVDEKGLTARQTTRLYELEHVLQEALSLVYTGDPAEQGLERVLTQKRGYILDARQRASREARQRLSSCAEQVRVRGREVSDLVQAGMDADEVNRTVQARYAEVAALVQGLDEDLQRALAEMLQDLQQEIEALSQSEHSRQLLESIRSHLGERIEGIDPATVSKARGVADVASRLGAFLTKHAFNPGAANMGEVLQLRGYSGTNVHTAIKLISKLFGKQLSPWGAVKWTRYASTAGKVLSVAGAVVSVVALAIEDHQRAKQERELRGARQALRGGFNEAAGEIEAHYTKTTARVVDGTLDPELEAVDAQLRTLRSARKTSEALAGALTDLADQTRALIREMHAGA